MDPVVDQVPVVRSKISAVAVTVLGTSVRARPPLAGTLPSERRAVAGETPRGLLIEPQGPHRSTAVRDTPRSRRAALDPHRRGPPAGRAGHKPSRSRYTGHPARRRP